jgi:elongation factor G
LPDVGSSLGYIAGTITMAQLIRNIGMIAHIDAGKTTTTERILYYSGVSHRMGEVDDGEATMDWMIQEQERGITITAAATSCWWRDYRINIIDTPGHVDFTAEVERALRVLDGAVGIFSAVEGVEPQSETVWHQADRHGVPRLAFINKLDRTGARFDDVVAEMRAKFGGTAIPIQVPIGLGSDFCGVVDLVANEEIRFAGEQGREVVRGPIGSEVEELAGRWRAELLDALATESDEITSLYVEDQPVPAELLQQELRRRTIAGALQPVLCGASLRNIGVQPLLDAITAYLPGPEEVGPVSATKAPPASGANGAPTQLPRSSDGPAVALVFKIQNDREAGLLSYLRVYSGRVESGKAIYNERLGRRERVARLLQMHANRYETLEAAQAGDIAVAVGFKDAQTGDTIGDQTGLLLEPIEFADPVISVAIESRSLSENPRLLQALTTVAREDPTFAVRENEETGQLLIAGMGELHLDVVVRRLADEYGLDVRVGQPQVAYRESVGAVGRSIHHYRRLVAGKENVADVTLRVEPRERGSGDSTQLPDDGILPAPLEEALLRGVTNARASGVLYGYPTIDIAASIEAAGPLGPTATETAFETAAALAFAEACRNATPTFLEPIMSIDVAVPSEHIGEVIGALSARGGDVQNMESKPAIEVITALAPLSRMFGYSTVLRSQTQGRGYFAMRFAHFSPTDRP